MIRHMFIGQNAVAKCLSEIPISENHPDFVWLRAPCDIGAVDRWIADLYQSPLLLEYRYGLLTDAHLLSEVAITRLLDVAENHTLRLHLWVASASGLIHTVQSRFIVKAEQGKQDAQLIGCEDTAVWDKFDREMELRKYQLYGIYCNRLS